MFRLLIFAFLIVSTFGLQRMHRRFPSNGRIIGGEDALEGQFPYQVRIMTGQFDSFICAGAIIGPRLVVTAARCFAGNMLPPTEYKVVAGNRHVIQTSPREQRRGVVNITVHEDFDFVQLYNDIALLHLDTGFIFDSYVKQAVLPPQGIQTPDDVIVTGWGTTTPDGIYYSDILQWARLPIVSDAECESIYWQDLLLESMICAGFAEQDKNTGGGDIGNPLLAVNGGYLAGIVSFVGVYGECGNPHKPGVHTELSYFRNWINANM